MECVCSLSSTSFLASPEPHFTAACTWTMHSTVLAGTQAVPPADLLSVFPLCGPEIMSVYPTPCSFQESERHLYLSTSSNQHALLQESRYRPLSGLPSLLLCATALCTQLSFLATLGAHCTEAKWRLTEDKKTSELVEPFCTPGRAGFDEDS